MIEMVLVVGIMSVVSALAMFQIGEVQPAFKGDAAMRTVMAQLNTARELSITQRRVIQVRFINSSEVQLVRQDIPVGTTVLATIPFEGRVRFALSPGVPDTPDAFGNGSPISFGAATSVAFTSDGTFISNSGGPANGTVFLAIPSEPRSTRAVTVLGATGRVRGYKWDGRQWIRV